MAEKMKNWQRMAEKMKNSSSGKFQTEDLVYLIRKDVKKYARVEELLRMNEVIKKAKKAFDTDELGATK